MPWAEKKYSDGEINRAGRTLLSREASSADLEHALEVVNNFRSCHAFPLNTFQIRLRRRSVRLDPGALIAQRIKRIPAIRTKLRNESTMNLSQMQDLGGCRAVLSDVNRAYAVRDEFKRGRILHDLVGEKDYIATPKPDGYRSIHLIYRYKSKRNARFNGLRIEIQIRSRLQHAWATAVETVGTMVQQALKSRQGDASWRRFFQLMGTVIAEKEGKPRVPGTPDVHDRLIAELRSCAESLHVVQRLRAYANVIRIVEQPAVKGVKYYLIQVRPSEGSMMILGFPSKDLPTATDRYLALERETTSPGSEVVLVAVESLDALRQAYPSYYLDAEQFIAVLKDALD